MADQNSSDDLLAKGGGRLEADASSRGFLQAAEEHRRQGEVAEAIELLLAGLEKHPNYISAQVALGRCYLEAGEVAKARRVLERVVDQDVTHMVAAKLLVEVHLQRSDSAQALRQLDLYSVLNNSDPDIEPLRQRIEALNIPAEPTLSTQGEPTDPPELVEAKNAQPSLSSADEGELPVAAVPARKLALGGATVIFPSLLEDRPHRLYLEKLGVEGIFPVAAPAPEVVVPEVSPEAETLQQAEVFEETSVEEAEPAVESAADEPKSTATLGELYLAQGHSQEAKRIFDEVLAGEPDNEAAKLGLSRLATLSEQTHSAAGEEKLPENPLERKKYLLMQFLKTLQRQPEPNVS